MDGVMMDRQLLVKRLVWGAENVFGDQLVVTRDGDGYDSCTYAEFGHRVRLLVGALHGLGVRPGDRVLTLAWNSRRHLEAYFAVPGMGAVLHAGNQRLSLEQLAFTINHAQDRVVLVDPGLLPVLESVWPQLTTVREVVVLGPVPEGTSMPNPRSYEDLLAAAEPVEELPEFDENTAAALCFTSGTTGDPKGVLYSHRSTVLHAMALCAAGSIGVTPSERYLLVTPMPHVNAWGMPYACTLAGARMILPGTHPKPEDLLRIVDDQAATTVVAAVTVGTMMRQAWERSAERPDLTSLRRLWLGGQAPSTAEITWWAKTAETLVVNGWGMTETSPMGTFCSVTDDPAELDEPVLLERQTRQGRPLPLVELRIVDDDGAACTWDGSSVGEFEVTAPWAAAGYFAAPAGTHSHREGWLRTGDIAAVHPDGSLQVKDRTKDLIKSGGEWISSVELENALMSHSAVREAAVVAVPDPTWVERPLACVHAQEGVSADELIAHLGRSFPRYWLPDRVLSVDEIPETSVGKFDKKRIRAQLADGEHGAVGVDGAPPSSSQRSG